jgi:hypothetical protein
MARKRTPVTGTYRVRRRTNDAPVDHMHNWNIAIQNGLDSLNWPKGDHEGVTVTLTATIRVVNPGSIIDYGATFI